MPDNDYEKLFERLAGDLQNLSPASLEENLRRAVDIKAQMKELKENPSFQLFCSALETQISARVEELCKSRPGLDGAVTNVHSIGEIAGLKLALSFADTMIESAEEAYRMNQHLLNLREGEE
jgi:hypothetical protein